MYIYIYMRVFTRCVRGVRSLAYLNLYVRCGKEVSEAVFRVNNFIPRA